MNSIECSGLIWGWWMALKSAAQYLGDSCLVLPLFHCSVSAIIHESISAKNKKLMSLLLSAAGSNAAMKKSYKGCFHCCSCACVIQCLIVCHVSTGTCSEGSRWETSTRRVPRRLIQVKRKIISFLECNALSVIFSSLPVFHWLVHKCQFFSI